MPWVKYAPPPLPASLPLPHMARSVVPFAPQDRCEDVAEWVGVVEQADERRGLGRGGKGFLNADVECVLSLSVE